MNCPRCLTIDTVRVNLSHLMIQSYPLQYQRVDVSDSYAHVTGRARQMLTGMLTAFFDKGKPVVRRGRGSLSVSASRRSSRPRHRP
jgi:hypothetical protein